MGNEKKMLSAIWVTPVVYKIWLRDVSHVVVGYGDYTKEVFDLKKTMLYSLVRAGLRKRDVIPAGLWRRSEYSMKKVYVWVNTYDFIHQGCYIDRYAQAAINNMTYKMTLDKFYECCYYEHLYRGVSLQSMRDNFVTYYNIDNEELNIDTLKKGQNRYIAHRGKDEVDNVMRGIGYKSITKKK